MHFKNAYLHQAPEKIQASNSALAHEQFHVIAAFLVAGCAAKSFGGTAAIEALAGAAAAGADSLYGFSLAGGHDLSGRQRRKRGSRSLPDLVRA